jgi:Tol biopolymer transport system component
MTIRRAALVAGLATMALFGGTSGAEADTIAYSCGYDLCLIDPDNPTDHSNLTETETAVGEERSPSWSPDGNWIAYFADYSGLYDAYVLDPTRSAAEAEPTDIANSAQANGNFETPPVWSPDSTRVAYEEEWFGSGLPGVDVFVSPFDGTAPQLAIGQTEDAEQHPAWSPDGTRIAYSGSGGVRIASADGTGTPGLLPNTGGGEPSWSPDGRYIATVQGGPNEFEVRIIDADGSGFHVLSKEASPVYDADWSPDGSRIAYADDEEPSGGTGALDQIWVAPADGSSPGNQVPMPAGWIVPHNPSFSPDGTRVAFDARPEGGAGHEQILVGPADGSSPAVPITAAEIENQEPDWKPGPGGPIPPGGGVGGGGSPEGGPSGGGGSGSGAGGSGAPGTGTAGGTQQKQTPVTIRLAALKRPIITSTFMTAVSIDCHAQGGHPTGKIAEICAAAANAYPTGVAPAAFALTAGASRAKPKAVLFASGKVKVPVGKTKPLKMKLTAAGRKMLKAGKKVSLKVQVHVTQPGGGSRDFTKTVTVKPPAKKH